MSDVFRKSKTSIRPDPKDLLSSASKEEAFREPAQSTMDAFADVDAVGWR